MIKFKNSLASLAIVFAILSLMGFACKDNTPRDPKTDGGKTKTKGGGRCSTEEEFKELLTKSFSQTFNERDGKFKETEVDFQKFDIGEPFRYQKTFPDIIDADPAYPVKTSFTKRDYLHETTDPRIFEERVKDYKYVFYVDHHGDCVFGAEGGGTRETEHIPFER